MSDDRFREVKMTVNGEQLTTAEAMTLRVAVTVFLMEMQFNGLGDDATGKAICAGYQSTCRSILTKMIKGAER